MKPLQKLMHRFTPQVLSHHPFYPFHERPLRTCQEVLVGVVSTLWNKLVKLNHFPKYTPEDEHGTWKWWFLIGISSSSSSFSGSMLIFGGVVFKIEHMWNHQLDDQFAYSRTLPVFETSRPCKCSVDAGPTQAPGLDFSPETHGGGVDWFDEELGGGFNPSEKY